MRTETRDFVRYPGPSKRKLWREKFPSHVSEQGLAQGIDPTRLQHQVALTVKETGCDEAHALDGSRAARIHGPVPARYRCA